MSVDATRWAWRQEISPSHKLVLLALADRAGEDNACWPSLARLEGDTGLDRKTIIRAIQAMEHDGILAVVRVLGAGNKYQLLGVENRETSPKNGTTPVPKMGQVRGENVAKPVPKTVWGSPQNGTGTRTQNGTSTKNGTGPKSGTPPVPITVRGSPKNGTTTSTKNGTLNLKEEPNKNLKGNLKERAILTHFGIEHDLAMDFIAHRKNHKAAITQTALEGFQREADMAGVSINDAIRISIERNWRGFRADWINRHPVPVHPMPMPTAKGQHVIESNLNASLKFLEDRA